ncbi:winged helix-turn-helix transcriptional regulator [Candidatus Pacearchaeota archaeon]|nr:winged helix-turn-helix transcriptional regulator [Candidatus Pacearchaeota archaeon]
MKQIELVYREILFREIEKKEKKLTQSELSKKLNLSLSIVNSAVKTLNRVGAVKISQRSFDILDLKKILYLWASVRNLEKDTIFKTRIDAPVRDIERMMPNVFFTAYTFYKLNFKDVPADYSEVYVYADELELETIKKRIEKFKTSEKNANLFILKKDALLDSYAKLPLSQLFVDLWNLKEWYAKDFLNALEKNLGV